MSASLPDAVSRMKIERFRELLQPNTDLEQRDEKGRTALFRASRLGKSDLVRLLLDRRADPNALDSSGEAPLQAAARYGHLECVEMLVAAGADLDHYPPPEKSPFSETAICSAARKQPGIAKWLLRHGADPNIASSARRLPLGMVLAHSGDVELVQLLIQAGADLNAVDHMGNTPLHHAAESGNIPLVRILLDAGAAVDSVNGMGEPVLCSAVLRSDGDLPEVVRVLLDYHPDLALKATSWEQTALELAIQQGRKEVAEMLVAAGSPPPETEGEGIEDECNPSDDGSQDDAAAVRISLGALPSLSPDDRALVDATLGDGHSLFRRFGWKASPAHWRILNSLGRKAIPAERVAYFVRGWLNRPAGQELADGPELLGESYHDALSRFVEEGLVVLADPREALALTHDTAQFKALAKKHALKMVGKKSELIQRLAEHLGLDALMATLPTRPHYWISDAGRAALDPSSGPRQEIIGFFRTELVARLEAHDVAAACVIARGLEGVLHPRFSNPLWQHGSLAGIVVAQARLILEKELPLEIRIEPGHEKAIRAIGAAATLAGDTDSDWDVWRHGVQPPRDAVGEPLGLHDFHGFIH